MSNFYSSRPYHGSIAKKPRLGPRNPYLNMGSGHGEDGNKRLITFKEFILSQSNDIDEHEALQLYITHKTEFMRKQIADFFEHHKDEEWFRNKYRSIELNKLRESIKESKIKRREAYEKLIERKDLIGEFNVDYSHNDKLSRFLDYYSLLLEGASLEDLESGEAHKALGVSSIFIPNVSPNIDKAIIEEYAASHEGFLRVAMSEAQPEKNFYRRAWITYKQMDPDNIRKLCWEYNAHKFNGNETKAMVNKEMNTRIRYPHFWFCHTLASKADLKNVAKLLTHFDGPDCPLIDSIKDLLIEETNEEEKALGVDDKEQPAFNFDQDPNLLKALDRIILYLRVVHSYDYYAATEYVGEDDMPQKVGIMFARPNPPSSFGGNPQEELKEFIEAHNNRIEAFLEKPTISEFEQKQLGLKDVEERVEYFINQHTLERDPGKKYVCKLTSKKFSGVQFVRKHILTRCSKDVEKVKVDAEFFNNYVRDPKRPM